MNRNQLKYFVAAAESRSFTKAAEQFYISQTAITQQIRLLEETLGCPLFDRSTRPVSLTSAGTIFLREAKGILERMSRAQERVHDASTGRNSTSAVCLRLVLSQVKMMSYSWCSSPAASASVEQR